MYDGLAQLVIFVQNSDTFETRMDRMKNLWKRNFKIKKDVEQFKN